MRIRILKNVNDRLRKGMEMTWPNSTIKQLTKEIGDDAWYESLDRPAVNIRAHAKTVNVIHRNDDTQAAADHGFRTFLMNLGVVVGKSNWSESESEALRRLWNEHGGERILDAVHREPAAARNAAAGYGNECLFGLLSRVLAEAVTA